MRRIERFLAGAILAAALVAPSAWAGSDRAAIKRPYNAATPAPGAGALVRTKAGTQHLDAAHYESVRDGALAMMKAYPPATHYYVALGRSPVSMYTFLHTLDPGMTSTFPASDLRLGINPAHEQQYFQHFEHYIPAEVLRGDRGDIVLFDRSHDQSGSSLARIKPVLEKYLASKGYQTKVVALGFAARGPLMPGVELMPTQAFPRVFIYNNGADHDEAVATYVGHHTIGTHAVNSLDGNPEHAGFARAMSVRMASDPKLDTALTEEPHLKSAVAP